MTIQQNIDYRVSVLDKVGVKITDADGTQRPIVSSDLEIEPTPGNIMRHVWMVTEYLSVYPGQRWVFSNKESAYRKAVAFNKCEDISFNEYIVTKHEVLS